MSRIIRIFAKALLEIWTVLRQIQWEKFKSKSTETKILVFGDSRFLFTHFGDITKMLYSRQHLVTFDKGFEAESIKTFLSMLHPGDIVLDIGANVGVYSLLAAEAVGDAGHVYAFEPASQTFLALQENIRLNGFEKRITALNLGLSDRIKTGRIASPPIADRYESGDAFNYVEDVEDNQTGAIQLTTVDQFIADNGLSVVNAIKLDIEGAELLCLKGAKELLSMDTRPKILFEGVDDNAQRYGYTAMDSVVFLANYEYRLRVVEFNQYLATPRDCELAESAH